MHEVLERLHAALAASLDEDRAALAAQLATAAYRRLPAAELEALDVDLAAARVRRALEALEAGDGDPAAVRTTDDGGTTTLLVHAVDGPFIASTVAEALHHLGVEGRDVAHPVVGTVRDEDGALRGLEPARQAERREVVLLLDLGRTLPEQEAAAVVREVTAVLDDALHAIGDFPAMVQAVRGVAAEVRATATARHPREEVEEVAAFLEWLVDDRFVLLGYRAYDVVDDEVRVTPGSGLGIMHDESASDYSAGVPLAELPELQRAHAVDGPLLHIVRTRRTSTVHRRVRMTSVGVQKVDADGRPAGEHRILGLLAQKAFVEPSSTIPVLRRKLRAVLDAEDVLDHSPDERAIRTLFDALPKQELFELPAGELRDQIADLLDVGRRQQVRLRLREQGGGSVSALVSVPRESFSAALREQVQQLLVDATGAAAVDYQLSMTERDQPLMLFTLHAGEEALAVPDVAAVEQQVTRLTRTFADRLADALSPTHGAAEARRLAERWSSALPPGYTAVTDVELAVADIAELEALEGPDDVRLRLVDPTDDRPLLRVRLCKAGPGVELSAVVPLLESLGLVVVEERPHELQVPGLGEAHVHDYGVRCELGPVDVATDGPRIAAAAQAMWRGTAGVDSLNQLVVIAGMSADQVAVLRAYRRYLRQVGTTYTEATTNDALLEHPGVARALVAWFAARFDPAADGDREVAEAAARQAVTAGLEAVTRLDQDRILRSFAGCVEATLRTNAWCGGGRLALKLDPSAVPGMPKPVPYREIFVHAPGMEGIHLRGGPIARGGLRWSDRLDDFRTEVLGLMKAQMSKNAVIVPTGSKGGFVLRNRPADPADLRAEVEAQYRVFISALLDVTDTIVDGRVVPPPDVVRHDGDDPYLVVAADRGTATFSDVANDISAEHGFWLGDAFASGGSQGYDHKEMGITARGAWVAVQRHFRELGVDVQSEPISVVGVGDMSGDVFGNGMLRSRTTRLVAAFDHRDIFLDPDPDPEVSFEERKRLFELPRSSWQDYDTDLISEGGGVWSRTAKAVPLSPQVRALLRVDAEVLSPPELVRAILSAPADLLFFGGIGTFVKAPGESDADVGDRANDAVRIDADQVGARVVGEGGNLAMTQRARIAYGRRGGRCNTDAIDNVAGVNTSDREVNLKILLRAAVEAGELDPGDRDDLLAAMTEEVAEQVLRDSYLQTWAVSQEVSSAPGGMGGYEMLMADLEARGRLDRVVEVLPTTAEVERRRQQGAGLTRAEVSVLLAYAKIDLTAALLAGDVVDQPAFDPVVTGYFPSAAADRFGHLVRAHRLRRELAATVVANEVCNRMGVTWAMRTAADMGVGTDQVAAAWWIAREVIDADRRWRDLEVLDLRADPALQLELKASIDWLVDAFTRSYVRQGRTGDVAAAVAQDRGPFEALYRASAARRRGATWAPIADRWIDLGVEEDLAEGIAALGSLTLVPGIAATARGSGRDVLACGEVYELVGRRLPLQQLTDRLMGVEPHGRWARGQHRGLLDDIRRFHHAAARSAIAAAPDDAAPAEVVDRWLGERAAAVDRALGLVGQVQGLPDPELDALAVAVRALDEVVG